MAKLHSRGRFEVLRVFKARDITPTDPLDTCIWEKLTIAYTSDGKKLEKRDVKFAPGPYDGGKPQYHSWGWKLTGRSKSRQPFTPEFIAHMKQFFLDKGFTIEIG
jgi:hypothetical protein